MLVCPLTRVKSGTSKDTKQGGYYHCSWGDRGSSATPTALSTKHRSASEMCLVVATGTQTSNIVLTPFHYNISPERDAEKLHQSPVFPNTDISAHILWEKHVQIVPYSRRVHQMLASFHIRRESLSLPRRGIPVCDQRRGCFPRSGDEERRRSI